MLNVEERVAIISARLHGLGYQQAQQILNGNSENQLLLEPVSDLYE
jgi:hypothetical protein